MISKVVVQSQALISFEDKVASTLLENCVEVGRKDVEEDVFHKFIIRSGTFKIMFHKFIMDKRR